MKKLDFNASRTEVLDVLEKIIDSLGETVFVDECLSKFTDKYLIDIANHFIQRFGL